MKQMKLTCMALAVLMIGSVLSGKLFAEATDGDSFEMAIEYKEKSFAFDFETPGFNPHTYTEKGGGFRTGTGDFLVSNFATGVVFNNFFWRGYAFTVTRQVTVTELWGGWGNTPDPCGASAFNGAIFSATLTGGTVTTDGLSAPEVQPTAVLRSVGFTSGTQTDDEPVQRVALSSNLVLEPGNLYIIAQGALDGGNTCHRSSNLLDIDNLLLGGIIINDWYPELDRAYRFGNFGTPESREGENAERLDEHRVLVGFRYITDVSPADLGPAANTTAAVVSNNLVLNGLLVDSGVPAPGSGELGENTNTVLYFEVSIANTPNFDGATLYLADVPANGTVTGPQTDFPFQRTVSGWASGADATATYYVRAVAINEFGRVTGATVPFQLATLEADPTSLSNYEAIEGEPSPAQTFVLTGSNLSAAATVTAPDHFEISIDGGATYHSSQTLPFASSINETIHVRITDSAPLGIVSGNVNITSAPAGPANVSVSGTVYVPPSLEVDPDNFTIIEDLILHPPYTSQFFTVSGEGLYEDVIVTAPDDFEISTDGVSFSTSLPLTPVPAPVGSPELRNVIVNQPIYFRVSEPQTVPRLVPGLFTVEHDLADTQIVSAGVRLIPLLWISVFVMILAITAFIVYRWRKTNVAMK